MARSIRLDVPYFSQIDNETDKFGSGRRQCNVTANAMLADYLLKGELTQTAQDLGMAEPEDYYDDIVAKYGDTTNNWAQTQALSDLGIASEWLTWQLTQEDIRRSLDQGIPMVIGVKFKVSGHILVVVGEDEVRGGFLIHDPFGIRAGSSDHYQIGADGSYDFYTYKTLKIIFDPQANGWGRIVKSVRGEATGL